MIGRNRCLMLCLATVLLLSLPTAGAVAVTATETRWSVGIDGERWQLPADETAGIAGLHLRRQLGAYWRWGADSFAAVQGRRGGFITLGVGGEFLYPLGRSLSFEAGLSLSAGGGRGGYGLSGGGLLVRESLGLGWALGDWRLRAGVSHVDFPNGGTITGSQWYAGLERRFQGLSGPIGAPSGRYELPEADRFSATELGVYVRPYRVRPGSLTDGGATQTDFGVVGAQWRGTLTGPWYYSVEAAGAAHGHSNGYMEILGGLGLRLPLTERWALEGGVSVGAGGGGAVDTGGGALWAAHLGAEWRFDDADALWLGVERLKAPGGHFAADGLTLGLQHRFGPAHPVTVAAHASTDLQAHPVRIRVTEQRYQAASASWSTRPIPDIGVLGLQADYALSPQWYLTGQGLAAYRGQSGAYMTGLIGVGFRQGLLAGIDFEAEALVGAAGGGGVAVASGAVAQANIGFGHEWPGGLGVHASLGRLRSLQGSFSAHVIGLSASYRTTLFSGAP